MKAVDLLNPSITLDAYRSFTRWAFVTIALLFGLRGTAATAFVADPLAVSIVATLSATLVTAAVAWYWPRRAPFGMLEVAAILATIGWVSAIWQGAAALASFALCLPFAYGIASRRPWWPWVLAALSTLIVAVIPGVIAGRFTEEQWLTDLLSGVFIFGVVIFVFISVEAGWVLFARMDAHRANENDLSIAQERLRFANELHDVQGHTLLAIKLKAELARRSLERAPEVARAELADIERLVAEASAQTREIANGYRPVVLATELANAERLLTAAGINTRIDTPPADAGTWESLFGAVTREGVSNILRHSDATNVSIRFTPNTLTIVNDGARDELTDADGGNGLVSLRERFEAHDGSITWRRDGRTFTLTVTRSVNGAHG